MERIPYCLMYVARPERLTRHPRPAADVAESLRPEQHRELSSPPVFFRDVRSARLVAVVDLDGHHLSKASEDLLETRLKRRQEGQMHRRSANAFSSRPVDCFFDCALRAAPSDDQQISIRITINGGPQERLLENSKLAASHRGRVLMNACAVRHLAALVMRKAGDCEHAARLARNCARRDAHSRIPFVSTESFLHWREVELWGKPFLFQLRPREWLNSRRQIRIGQDHDDNAECFSDLPCRDD